jgi:hemerythrin-like domain-containing protein
MLRDKNLVSLSRQHQHALALCVRIGRGLKVADADRAPWQAEIASLYESEIRFHFDAEEIVLFPAARRFATLTSLVDELIEDHRALREYVTRAKAGELGQGELLAFAQRLSAHVRREERQLFEECQRLMSRQEMDELGRGIEEYFRTSGMPGASCAIG